MIFTQKEIEWQLLAPQKNYTEAKRHSELLDQHLGYKCEAVEKELIEKSKKLEGKQLWIGLDIQALQTPHSEVVEMIHEIRPKPKDCWIDLGAGYGRVGIVLGFLQKEVHFVGYEYLHERVNEGNRVFEKWHLKNASLIQADLTSSALNFEEGDVFFIYDFGSRLDIYSVLEKIRSVAKKKPISVIARGRGIKNWILIDFPWLSQVKPPSHFENWSLFRS